MVVTARRFWLAMVLLTGCVEVDPAWGALGSTASESESSSGTDSTTDASTATSTASTATTSSTTTSSSSTSSASSGGPGTSSSTTTTSESSSSTGPAAGNTIFATSTILPGNFGGPVAADMVCQNAANGANLGGIWKAVVSVASTDARDRFILPGEIRNTQGELVAGSADAFWAGQLANPIRYDETGTATNSAAWTGSDVGGTIAASNCGDWTQNNGTGIQGATAAGDSDWINKGVGGCNNSLRLYCIDQR